jgi:hypothetical protein
MSWTYEVALRGEPHHRLHLQTWLRTHAREACAALPGLAHFDLYTPADGSSRDPYNNDGTGPLMMLMLDFVTRDALAAAIASGGVGAAVDAVAPDIAATGAAFERRYFPVGGDTTPGGLQAPFSYVVRYHRPADDEAAFIENYIATHPSTQAKLPGIRSIVCYLPLHDVRAHGQHQGGRRVGGRLQSPDYMIGNEVVFDHIDDFNVAMASPARHELRAHYHAFPRFTGGNTHHPMTRTRLVG